MLATDTAAQAKPLPGRFPQTPRSRDAVARNEGRVASVLANLGVRLGAPVYLRITKDPKRVDVFLESASGAYVKFRSYDVCAMSGVLGPKQKEGDKQAPEGFYAVTRDGLRPGSDFHLGLDIGYPNAFDRQNKRTGSEIVVHGACYSIGCFAMTDPAIEEIYTIVEAAMRRGQAAVPIHIYPFPMNAGRLRRERQSPWLPFWTELQRGWDLFEQTKRPPKARARSGRYVITSG